jgi:RimJ/RimL family protein N-acetyltransferase
MDVSRIQATTSIKNKGSQRVLEKAGFTREGTIRKSARGARRDAYLYSILREEWKEPKILTRTEKK